MKVKFGCRCIGLPEPVEEIEDVPDGLTDDELENMASDHGQSHTEYEHWYEIVDKLQ